MVRINKTIFNNTSPPDTPDENQYCQSTKSIYNDNNFTTHFFSKSNKTQHSPPSSSSSPSNYPSFIHELQSINLNWLSFMIGITCLFCSTFIIVIQTHFGKIQDQDKIKEQNQHILKLQRQRKNQRTRKKNKKITTKKKLK